jgi:hypothetical protein
MLLARMALWSLLGLVASSTVASQAPKITMDLFARMQPPAAGFPFTTGDINGDGYRDFVGRGPYTINYRSYMMAIWLGGKDGFVERTTQLAPELGSTLGVVVGRVLLVDMDRDGDLDFVSGHAGFDPVGRNWLAVNDGQGRFIDASARLGLGPTSTPDVRSSG